MGRSRKVDSGAAQAEMLGVMLEFGSRTIQAPIEASESGAFEIDGTLSAESDALGEELFAEVALVGCVL